MLGIKTTRKFLHVAFTGVEPDVKRHFRRSLGKKTKAELDTLEFFKEMNPSFTDRSWWLGNVPYFSRGVSYIPKLGNVFTPPDPFNKLTPDVSLKAVFSDKAIGADKIQKMFNRLDFTKSGRTLNIRQYRELREIADTRNLHLGSLGKAFVTNPQIRYKRKGIMDFSGRAEKDLVNLNPMSKNKIGAHKLIGVPDDLADKISFMLRDVDGADKTLLLQRFSFSKVKVSKAGFLKLEKLANAHGLDVFADFKLKPHKIVTEKIKNPELQDMLIYAVRNNQPLDLRCVNLKKCNLVKVLPEVEALLNAEGKSLKGLNLQTSLFTGAKMSFQQKQEFDALLAQRTPKERPIDEKKTAIAKPVMLHAKEGVEAVANAKAAFQASIKSNVNIILNFIGVTSNPVAQPVQTPQTQATPQPTPPTQNQAPKTQARKTAPAPQQKPVAPQTQARQQTPPVRANKPAAPQAPSRVNTVIVTPPPSRIGPAAFQIQKNNFSKKAAQANQGNQPNAVPKDQTATVSLNDIQVSAERGAQLKTKYNIKDRNIDKPKPEGDIKLSAVEKLSTPPKPDSQVHGRN